MITQREYMSHSLRKCWYCRNRPWAIRASNYLFDHPRLGNRTSAPCPLYSRKQTSA